MTGLDSVEDRILEVAAIVTDWDFTEIATYEGIVSVDSNLLTERMTVSAEFWDVNPIAREGLIAQNTQHGRPRNIIENELLAFIAEHCEEDEKVLLAGNSIHQDRKFIANEWPQLDAKLHYRMLDVSAWKVVFESKYKIKFSKPEAHRALSDIRGSIEELQYYLKKAKL